MAAEQALTHMYRDYVEDDTFFSIHLRKPSCQRLLRFELQKVRNSSCVFFFKTCAFDGIRGVESSPRFTTTDLRPSLFTVKKVGSGAVKRCYFCESHQPSDNSAILC
mmetsp:Transcript_42424/g.73444  ORF Transcript_42424/g.73444 Transcript_42424/m.73444 type:complete len:107 (-) Transcript_42424:19-339(-)